MDVLSIGNSFSQDVQRYINAIAKADGAVLNTYNLYIGGCPLSLHYRNMLNDEKAYFLEMNGDGTGFKVTLKEALLNRNWDVVTVQQLSGESPRYETYQPYLDSIVKYVRKCVPKAKIVVHQTWAYEQGCRRMTEELGYSDSKAMFEDIKKSYKKAADDINADFTIPSGELFHELTVVGMTVHRDTYHAKFGIGRYALGLLWYAMLTGRCVDNLIFSDFDESVTPEEEKAAKECVKKVCSLYAIK